MITTRAFIFARGGSKGIKRKNLALFNEHPLIAQSILMAQQLSCVEKVYVSTDSDEIAHVSKNYGASIIKRPSELASDTSPEWLSWQHAIKKSLELEGEFDRFISLPTTSPLRKKSDVEKCLDALNDDIDIVITATESKRNPWFNMVQVDNFGRTKLICQDNSFSRRQDAPSCFDITTVAYVSTPNFILKNERIWEGSVCTIKIPPERAIDIDTQIDLEFARFLSQKEI